MRYSRHAEHAPAACCTAASADSEPDKPPAEPPALATAAAGTQTAAAAPSECLKLPGHHAPAAPATGDAARAVTAAPQPVPVAPRFRPFHRVECRRLENSRQSDTMSAPIVGPHRRGSPPAPLHVAGAGAATTGVQAGNRGERTSAKPYRARWRTERARDLAYIL